MLNFVKNKFYIIVKIIIKKLKWIVIQYKKFLLDYFLSACIFIGLKTYFNLVGVNEILQNRRNEQY
jgi:hypothetical protein